MIFKRFISTTFVAIATSLLIALSVVSHHHHNGAVCMEVVVCEYDGRINDEHTGHLPHEREPVADDCVAEKSFVRTINETEDRCSVPDCTDGGHTHPLDTFFILAVQLFMVQEAPSDSCGYGEPLISYRSADVDHSTGLRGPPSFIS